MTESKSVALTLGYTPIFQGTNCMCLEKEKEMKNRFVSVGGVLRIRTYNLSDENRAYYPYTNTSYYKFFSFILYIYYIIFFIKNQIKYNNFEIIFMFISLKLIYCGAPRRARTSVPLVNNNQQLCQLSYRGKNSGGTSPLLVDPGHSTSPNIIENLFLIRQFSKQTYTLSQ